MTTTAETVSQNAPDYKRRTLSWAFYDWANSAFATTILAAILPVFYSGVAGATLDKTVATRYWSLTLSVAMLFSAVLSPLIGSLSDIRHGKKSLLAVLAGIGIVATGLMSLIGEGGWLLASFLFVFGRLGFSLANVVYNAMLNHVATPQDEDRVSTLGYALGYIGGGLLLAINIGMISLWGSVEGSRVSFLSVAIWWAVFTVPLLRWVPEPKSSAVVFQQGQSVIALSLRRLRRTLRNMRRYRQLLKYLIAFLVYNDGIGTIIGVATIYGNEMGFGATEMILALLLVQIVAAPFSIIFGKLPDRKNARRPFYLAFIVWNAVALPLTALFVLAVLPPHLSGAPAEPRTASLPLIMGLLLVLQALGLLFASTVGKRIFAPLAETLDTRRAILLGLAIYSVIAVWGYFIDSVIEFWFLAWMIAIVQGGSQALSRSLFASMVPDAESGEFFGFYSIMDKFASIFGPLIFAVVNTLFGSSRPAVMSLIVFFIVGGLILSRVDVEEGQRIAREIDDELEESGAVVEAV